MPSLALGFRFRKGEGTGGKYRGIECACAFCSVLLQQSRGERSLRAANSTVTGPRKCKCVTFTTQTWKQARFTRLNIIRRSRRFEQESGV